MKKRYWILATSYPLPINMNRDKELERIVGKERSGSGAGFGMRDIDWYFDTQTKANTATKALRQAGYKDISINEYERDDDGQTS